jgi:hypothetical protein
MGFAPGSSHLTDAIRVGENESVGWKEHAMGGVSAKDVDGYLVSIPEDARAAPRDAWGDQT